MTAELAGPLALTYGQAVPRPWPDEAAMVRMVLYPLTSDHSKRSYAAGLRCFFLWCRTQPPGFFSKSLLQAYRDWLLGQNLSPATVNLRLAPVRRLAVELVEQGWIPDPGRAAGVSQRAARGRGTG